MIIYSGGQTGVDRAAWDAAIEVERKQNGWVPKGRLSEDGSIPSRYTCLEMETSDYAVRTEKNLLVTDATLILTFGPATGGTLLTGQLCRKHTKPHLVLDLDLETEEQALGKALNFISTQKPSTLNVAGPRGSYRPDVYPRAKTFLVKLLSRC